MFWKGPVFTKDGFTGKGIDLGTCSIADTLDVSLLEPLGYEAALTD